MAVKLHRCSGMWAKFSGHPCWRVQKALDDSGIEYEIVNEGSSLKGSSRASTIEKTGQKQFPWIEFEDGSRLPRGVEGHGRDDPSRETGRKTASGRATLSRRGAIAQLGERLDRTQEVVGSSPASSIPFPSSGCDFEAALEAEQWVDPRCAVRLTNRERSDEARRSFRGVAPVRLHGHVVVDRKEIAAVPDDVE